MARGLELDLVEVAPNANPPVCRIMDYGKFKYEEGQKAKEARKKSTNRGPQREAIESSMRTTEPVRMALIRSQPGRAATVDAFCPQQTVSASTMMSGLDETTYSAESCG